MSNELTPDLRASYRRITGPAGTEDDLIACATFEAEGAMLSTPPHCLPTAGGLPHNEDHANACAHRCWSFLGRLAAKRKVASP